MTPGAKTVHEAHEPFQRQVGSILVLADAVGTVPTAELARRTGELHEFLAHSLMPHALAEDSIFFPALRQGSDDPRTVAMTRCHRQLALFTDELEAQQAVLSDPDRARDAERELKRILYGTHALLTTHFAAAEAAFTDTLAGKLSPAEREELFARIDRYADDVAKLLEFGG